MSSISKLTSQISKAKKKKKEYEKRRKELEDIQSKLKKADDYADDISDEMKRCATAIESGDVVEDDKVKAPKQLRDQLEKGNGEDSHITGVSSYISKEIKRCNQKISEYEKQIASWNNEIKIEKKKERES